MSRLYRVLSRLGQDLFGQDEQVEAEARAVFEQWFSQLDPNVQRMLGALITACDALPLLSRSLKPLSGLPEKSLTRFVQTVRHPYGMMILRLVKGLCGVVYLSSEGLTRRLGYGIRAYKQPSAPPPPEASLCVEVPSGGFEARYDVVVVGTGAGGATVARCLSEAGLRVALVEEGELATRTHTQLPLLERARRFYRQNGFTLAFGMPPVMMPMGRTVGGTTVVNSGTCFRTPHFVLERWRNEFGVQGMAPAEVEPLFDWIEQELCIAPVADEVLGGNGQVVRRGAERLSVRHQPLNRPQRDCHGTGVCALICPRDAKLDMRFSMLQPAQRHDATIFTCCRVERVLFEGERAVGVEGVVLTPAGGHFRLLANHVVLSAGAIYTPWILRRSGVRHPRIGRNLHIHPSVSVFSRMPEAVNGWSGVMQSYGVTEWIEQGTLIEATFPPLAIGYGLHPLPGWGPDHQRLLESVAHLAGVGVLTADEHSEGRIVCLPGASEPLIVYRLHQADAQRILHGIARAAQIFFAAGAECVYTDLPGAEQLETPNDLNSLLTSDARYLNLSAYHPGGTCCLGEDANRCPVDSFGRARGQTHPWAADASLIPTPTVVNPQITIMMLAARVARSLLQEV